MSPRVSFRFSNDSWANTKKLETCTRSQKTGNLSFLMKLDHGCRPVPACNRSFKAITANCRPIYTV